jgi:hypothetical protein
MVCAQHRHKALCAASLLCSCQLRFQTQHVGGFGTALKAATLGLQIAFSLLCQLLCSGHEADDEGHAATWCTRR